MRRLVEAGARAVKEISHSRIGGTVNLRFAGCVLLAVVSLASSAQAQATSNRSFGEAQLFSLYLKRHDMTIQFADLARTHASDGQVRKTAEEFARAHREAREKLERIATERHLTLAPPEGDTSTALLAQARTTLEGRAGRSFDSTWANLAYNWLSTLILDNNRVVSARATPELQPVVREHTTWLFHQSVEADKLRKRFK